MKKKLMKIIIGALAFLSSVSIVPSIISAEEANVNIRKTEYSYQFDESYPAPFNDRTYEQYHWVFTMNNTTSPRWTYCIDYAQLTDEGYSYSYSDSYNGLSNQQSTLLNRVLMFGFNEHSGTQYGGTADEESIATQSLIWIITSGHFNGEWESRIVDVLLKDSPKAKQIYYTMKQYVSNFTIVPSFSSNDKNKAPTHTLTYNMNTKMYELTLNDSNNVLRYFNFINDTLTIKKSNNTLTINSKTPFTSKSLQSIKQLPTDELPNLIGGSIDYWLSNAYQPQANLNIHGDYNKTYGYFNLNTVSVGNVTIQKIGEQLVSFEEKENGSFQPVYKKQNIADTIFAIYNSNNVLVDTITTNNDGKSTSVNLNLGDYYAKEVACPDGLQLNSNPIPFTLKKNGEELIINTSFSMYNERQKASISLSKTFEMDDSQIQNPYDYVKFGVYNRKDIVDKNGIVLLKENSLIEVFEVDENGDGNITTDLPLFQDYYIKELETATGYVLEDIEYDFTLDNPDKLAKVELKINDAESIHNRLLRGNLKVIKIDEEGTRLNNAIFGLFDSKGEMVKQFNIVENGEFSIDGLLYGSYTLREIRSPEGHIVNDKVFTFDIIEDKQIVEVTYINNKFVEENPKSEKETKVQEVVSVNTTPATGDTTNINLLGILMITSSIAIVSIVVYKKRMNDA